jgi:Protein of unknown function (DUF3142)
VKPPMKGQPMNAARPYRTGQPNPRQRHLWQWPALIVVAMAVVLGTLGQLTLHPWLAGPAAVSRDALAAFPQVMLWAWERPELLDFIDPNGVGVAFLARTLYLSGPEVIIRPRLQPLQVPPETKLMAVVRIEADRRRPPDLSVSQREVAAAAIVDVSGLHGVGALQIDFDAAVSQRRFYHDVLHHVRRQLPTSMPLSMTALASWCLYDDWLTGVPVDEVVPMVFRMGADQHRVRRHLAYGDFRPAYCRHSVGISTDEPLPALQARRRLYLFHPRAWRSEAMASILEEVGR